jgi:hypothetical protein
MSACLKIGSEAEKEMVTIVSLSSLFHPITYTLAQNNKYRPIPSIRVISVPFHSTHAGTKQKKSGSIHSIRVIRVPADYCRRRNFKPTTFFK